VENKQKIWKVLQGANFSKGLMKRIENIYGKCENNIVIDENKTKSF
jgi:hypothetical protein